MSEQARPPSPSPPPLPSPSPPPPQQQEQPQQPQPPQQQPQHFQQPQRFQHAQQQQHPFYPQQFTGQQPPSSTLSYVPHPTQAFQQVQAVPAVYNGQGVAILPHYVSPKGMWISKLVLRITSLLFCIVIAAVAGSAFPYAVPFIMVGVPGLLGACWDIAEGISILAREGHRGIHPGANVALDLIIWLYFVVSAGIGAGINIFYLYGYDYGYGYYGYYGPDDDVYAGFRRAADYGPALFALAVLLTLLHLATFIIACYETHIRNRGVYGKTIVVVPNGAAYAGPPPVYYTGNQPIQMPPPVARYK